MYWVGSKHGEKLEERVGRGMWGWGDEWDSMCVVFRVLCVASYGWGWVWRYLDGGGVSFVSL